MTSSSPNNPLPRLSLSGGRCLILFVCLWGLCLIISSFIVGFIMYKWPGSPRAVRIATVFQDILAFIVPAVVTAVMTTRLPARLLGIGRLPRLSTCALAVCTLIVAIPLINAVVLINESISLPESMSGIEQWMRDLQQSAASSIDLVLGGDSVGSLIISILMVGILAALSEELVFRGCLQRLLSACRMNHHAAIWIAAAVFSAIHMQFFGFFPRLLLGALFGYVFYWSGSLWTSVALHATNNIIYVLGRWVSLRSGVDLTATDNAADYSPTLIIVSTLLVVAGLYLVRRSTASGIASEPSVPKNENKNNPEI